MKDPTTADLIEEARCLVSSRARFMSACSCQPVDRPPIWLMRQAGRCLPEYRALRERHSFLELVRTPVLAAEVTIQPIRRFGFDAAIIFSDILVIAEALGQPYQYTNGEGIKMEWAIEYDYQIEQLEPRWVAERLGYVEDALKIVRTELKNSFALIGFAGAPWTLANFMVEGTSTTTFSRALNLFRENPRLYGQLAEKLTLAIADFLKLQIAAGADAIQIFDTLAGIAPASDYGELSGRWLRDLITELRGHAPVILFAKGINCRWSELGRWGAQVVSVDSTVSLREVAEQLPSNVAVQGNLDPNLLQTDPYCVSEATRRLLESMRGRAGHIVNLGHGVPPEAKLDCIAALVETVKGFK